MMASQLNQVSSAEGQYYFIANITGAWYGNGVQQVKDINTPNAKYVVIAAFPALFLEDHAKSDIHWFGLFLKVDEVFCLSSPEWWATEC
ncbi:hypothetical protein IV203_014724 [Nitzschia inconspicua]|uniref:Uncharacterized protein n=1 Tax=Nitzschia inconspicua TaxID=303405 RepID=A0A9K3PSL3_9STRA|nr:hypothetical protein IV203_014724 [Nitzschia inconspicua]